jgi:pilus assembly protein CpaB
MGRRTVLLVVAALIAALGSAMVYLYVRGADNRALAKYAPTPVLTAVSQIDTGESLGAAQAAGKLQLTDVPANQVLTGAMQSVGDLSAEVALVTIYPNEQLISAKIGTAGTTQPFTLPDGMIAVSASLSDTGRVAGFVQPGSHVAIFQTSADAGNGVTGTRLLLPDVQVISVGSTTVAVEQAQASGATGTAGAQNAEPLPKTLFTFAVTQDEAQKIIYASSNGTLDFGLLSDTSKIEKQLPATTGKNLFK